MPIKFPELFRNYHSPSLPKNNNFLENDFIYGTQKKPSYKNK
jgi:hypothetical protein